MRLKFWGVRGSIAVPGSSTIRYGGNTPCVEVSTAENIIILDAGTGIRELGNYMLGGNDCRNIHLMISHTHWDHLLGIPFFKPMFNSNAKVKVYFSREADHSMVEVIDALMHPYFFPVSKSAFSANISYMPLDPDIALEVDDISVEFFRVNHSKGTLAYKLKHNGKSVVYMTDNEIEYSGLDIPDGRRKMAELNEKAIEFCRGCDYLIHDSTYLVRNYEGKRGWGHSNNASVAMFAGLAGVKNLVLFHYDPEYNDDIVDEMLKDTTGMLKSSGIGCIAACEGLEINV